MKVIKRSKNKWIGKTINCPKCGCLFQLEEGDEIYSECYEDGCFLDEDNNICPKHKQVKCPECQEMVNFEL